MFPLVALSISIAQAAPPSLSFEQAADRGMVDMAAKKPAAENAEIFAHLREISPGIVDGFAFFFGGPKQQHLDSVQPNVEKIREQVPEAMTVAGWSEGVSPHYDETLKCGEKGGEKRFSAETITSGRRQTSTTDWVDMAKPEAVAFYDCVAKSYIDSGINILRFEAPVLMIKNSENPGAAIKGFAVVAEHAKIYAGQKGDKIYFIGDAELAKHVHMDGIYTPSRFFHTTLASALKYQNKISRPGIGDGYSYALSPRMVEDTVGEVPAGTKVFFDVDHWDSKQDDLRRFMELDAENRRFLIQQSMRNARKGGASFVPPLDTCGGCTPRSAVVDECEKPPNPSPDYTEYNIVRCGDLAAVKEALHGR